MAATFIKRQDNDTKVIVDITQPPESIGALTPSGDGYLIPDDLTETQKDNVQKIINVLKITKFIYKPTRCKCNKRCRLILIIIWIRNKKYIYL